MNIAYVLNLIGLAVKNILILRVLMIMGQLILIYTGYVRGNWIVMFWNAIFLIINLFRIILLLLERRKVKLSEELQDIYDASFFNMTEREFLRFWALGSDEEIDGGYIISSGETADSVFMIINGSAYVQNGINTVAILGRADFIGEMSFITGKAASADVISDMKTLLHVWKSADIQQLKIKNNAFWVKIQQALGHDLVTKVRKSNERVPVQRG